MNYRGLKKEISEELGDSLVDLAHLADSLEAEKKMGKLDDPVFEKWFKTIVNQVQTLSGLVDISSLFQTPQENPSQS